ncbi:IS3 family transposase [Streptomyces sp. 3211]|uniref:IS3 family transposase n=1 Tax=Streptomyces sp. 3211 TaxID=1964449 RepID=UPI003FA7205A
MSRSGFFYWRRTAAARAARQAVEAELAARMCKVRQDSDGTCKALRITAELRDEGERVNRRRVERSCGAPESRESLCVAGTGPPPRTRQRRRHRA